MFGQGPMGGNSNGGTILAAGSRCARTVRAKPCRPETDASCLAQLTDVQSGQEVASSKSANVLLGRDMQLDVHPDLLPILDFVVLTFIIVEARRQEAIREAANSAGG